MAQGGDPLHVQRGFQLRWVPGSFAIPQPQAARGTGLQGKRIKAWSRSGSSYKGKRKPGKMSRGPGLPPSLCLSYLWCFNVCKAPFSPLPTSSQGDRQVSPPFHKGGHWGPVGSQGSGFKAALLTPKLALGFWEVGRRRDRG